MSIHSHADHDPDHHSPSAGGHLPPTDSECREALERLYVYLDGELTEDRCAVIRSHLEECSPCLEAFDFEAEFKMLISRHCRDDVPEHLRVRVAFVLSQASEEQSASGDASV